MSNQVANQLISALSNRARVDSELLLATLIYVEMSQGRPPCGINPPLEELLQSEAFSQDALEEIRRLLIQLLVEDPPLELQISAVRVLQEFHDPKLVSLLSVLLDRHLRSLLKHNAAVSQLLFALADCGAPVGGISRGIGTVELNIELARKHLSDELGLQYPN